jgi:hypothetical protein
MKQLQILRWEEPPPSRQASTAGGPRRGSQFDKVAAELRERRGQSAVIYRGSKARAAGICSRVNAGTVKAFQPAGTFRAVQRSWEGVSEVYAWYVGPARSSRVAEHWTMPRP